MDKIRLLLVAALALVANAALATEPQSLLAAYQGRWSQVDVKGTLLEPIRRLDVTRCGDGSGALCGRVVLDDGSCGHELMRLTDFDPDSARGLFRGPGEDSPTDQEEIDLFHAISASSNGGELQITVMESALSALTRRGSLDWSYVAFRHEGPAECAATS